jgi:hypothetical protein
VLCCAVLLQVRQSVVDMLDAWAAVAPAEPLFDEMAEAVANPKVRAALRPQTPAERWPLCMHCCLCNCGGGGGGGGAWWRWWGCVVVVVRGAWWKQLCQAELWWPPFSRACCALLMPCSRAVSQVVGEGMQLGLTWMAATVEAGRLTADGLAAVARCVVGGG